MIAIDMEMPKSCEECPMMFMHLGQIEKYCRITKEVLGTYRKKISADQQAVRSSTSVMTANRQVTAHRFLLAVCPKGNSRHDGGIG